MSKLPTTSWIVPIVVLPIIVLLSWNCHGAGEQYRNIPPVTHLSNVPPPDTFIVTQNQRLTLSWIGNDPDGYVTAFRYRWSFRLNSSSPFQYKPWATILNLWNIVGAGSSKNLPFALLTDASISRVPAIYHYFSILLNGLDDSSANQLWRGDTISVLGSRVWASNPITEPFPVHTAPTSGTFIFDSQDSLNPHTFEVEAIDNAGAVGLPASVSFATPRVVAPQTEIIQWPVDTVMVLMEPTVTFPGVNFTFEGFDPNSRTLDYQWVIDRDQWPPDSIPWSNFSQQTSVYATAKNFRDPLAHKHTFYVRARNEFGVIDTLGVFTNPAHDANNNIIPDSFVTVRANVDFYTLYPPFKLPGYQPRTLLLNFSHDWSDATPTRPSQAMITDFYTQMLNNIGQSGQFDVFNVIVDASKNESFPGRGTLGLYNLIVMVGDAIDYGRTIAASKNYNYNGVSPSVGPFPKEKLTDYCNVGGKMIISAWALPWTYNAGIDTSGVGTSTDFMSYICHMQDEISDPPGLNLIKPSYVGFLGASGRNGYPDVVFDSTKADTSLWGIGLQWIYTGRPYGFGEILYNFVSDSSNYHNTPQPPFFQTEPTVVASRYIGVTYSVIYFGFPLYYIQVPGVSDQPSATAILRKAFSDLNQ
jgi:hypothetical protein